MMKLFRLLKSYRLLIAIILIFTFLQSMAQLFLPTLMAAIVDVGIVNEDISYIIQMGGVMLLVAVASVALSIGGSFCSAKVSAGFGKMVRDRVFAQVQDFSLQAFNKFGTSSLITRTTNDIMQIQQLLTMMLKILLVTPLMFIGALILAIWIDPMLSLFIFAPIPIIAVTIIIITKKGIPLFQSLKQKTDRLNLILREGLTGVRIIRSFNRSNDEMNRFQEANTRFSDTAIKVNRVMIHLTPIMMFVLNFSIIAIIWFGAFRIDTGELQIGQLMAFIQYATQIMFSLTLASVMVVAIPRAAVSANRINEILDYGTDIKPPHEAIPIRHGRGHIEFHRVTFSYPGAMQPILSDISFHAKPGEVTAIIGGTGTGKSTLANLIPRFYDIDDGSILVDGIDIRNISSQQLRNHIGLVPQQPYLFKGTIADNIRYGKEQAIFEEVHHAAWLAQASTFISEMKEGYESPVAQKGSNFSGGQRQRLAIARALVRKANIYIFDDSFSALDFKTHARLNNSLQEDLDTSTVLMMTQRVSTVMDADQIVVLDEGRIAGVGKHQDLMKNCEVYREMVSVQFSTEELS